MSPTRTLRRRLSSRCLAVMRSARLLPAADAVTPALPPPQTDLRRRGVCAATLVAGSLTLRWSLGIEPGSTFFYPATAALALLWAMGGRLSGPVPHGVDADEHEPGSSALGRDFWHELARALLVGLALLALYLVGAVAVSQVGSLRAPVEHLLDHARRGSLPLVAVLTAVNGVAEEYFFRGALLQAIPRRWQLPLQVGLYTAVTACSGIPLLAMAGCMLGVLVTMQRRTTGSLLVPCTTHLTWSLGMLFLLPGVLQASRSLLS